MYQIGTASADITPFYKGVGMMGYGQYHQKVQEKETDLFARTFVFHDPESGKKIAFVNAEMCFITLSIKSEVIKRLQKKHAQLNYRDENVMLTAQHTHSATGGYSHFAFFNFSIPGFVPEVFNTIVNGIVRSVVEADSNLQDAKIKIGRGIFPPEQDVAFNRSMKAYNANPEVEKLKDKDRNLALDREMTMLRVDGTDGKSLGTLNWFGVHTTSVGNDRFRICSDNKGYASQFFEDSIDNPNFCAVFAQAPCADIMPNFIWEGKRNKMRGKFEDDFESARYNGNLQYEKAKEIYDGLANASGLATSGIDYGLMYVDLADVLVDDQFIPEGNENKGKEVRTGHACLGVAFFRGTVDGIGIPASLGKVVSLLTNVVKMSNRMKSRNSADPKWKGIEQMYETQGVKDILVETGAEKILGVKNLNKLGPISLVDPSFKVLKQHYDQGAISGKPWTPQILPLQIFIIGEIAIVGIPAEISYIGGKRLKKTISNVLVNRGVTEVIISPYANAYSGYITTYEEYQHQCYEGGHTVFGQWTQAAYQTKFQQLAKEMLKTEAERELDKATKPLEFSQEELAKRCFPTPLN